jgi:hypothetical protein
MWINKLKQQVWKFALTKVHKDMLGAQVLHTRTWGKGSQNLILPKHPPDAGFAAVEGLFHSSRQPV